MNGIIATKYMVYLAIAILTGITCTVIAAEAMDPLKSEQAMATSLATSIALDLNSLMSAEEGRTEMEIDPGTNFYITITYHNAGAKKGYSVDADGYYVVVSIEKSSRTVYGIRRIDGYPSSLGTEYTELETEIWKPKGICVVKDRGSRYPKVKERMLVC